MELLLERYHQERLDDPLIQLTVPEEQIATARDPEAWERTGEALLEKMLPDWVPSFVTTIAEGFTMDEDLINGMIKSSSEAILTMHNAGIPIVVGSDSGNWSTFVNFFHGPSTIREIELLAESGMPAIDVVSSATRLPAEMMGVSDRVGTIEVGNQADLIVVNDDPLQDFRALRNLIWVIKEGEIRSPAGWMSD
jgi:imidazolonepropionase-like amidohydrolase